jgi:hypothetical protein
MIRLVLPCSAADIHLLPDFTELFRRLGGCPRHPVYLCPTHDVQSQAQQAALLMSPFAKSVQVIPWNMDNKQNWPIAGNDMFIHCMIEMEVIGDTEPKYFCELDNCFTIPGFMDKLETEYVMSGAKFMGAVVGTRKYPAGRLKEAKIDESDPHMVGTGIYPPFLNQHTDGQYRFARFEPWDIFLRFYMRRSLHKTSLIDHHWSTINYKEVDGQIVGENSPDNPFGTDHSGPISKEAVVVHGCKDGSLTKLLLSKLPEVGKVVIPAPLKEEKNPVSPPRNAPKVEYDRGAFQNFQRLANPRAVELPKPPPIHGPMQGVEVKAPEAPVFAELPSDAEVEGTSGEQAEPDSQLVEEQTVTEEKPIEERIMDAIESNPKSYRLSDLAKKLGVTPLKLKKLAKDPNASFKILLKGGWVKKKELVPA